MKKNFKYYKFIFITLIAILILSCQEKKNTYTTMYNQTSDSLSALTNATNLLVISTLKPISPSINKGFKRIEALGYLTYNPNYTNSIAARISGRIEQTFVKYNFQSVRKGEKLLNIYSPELLTIQNEYLLLYRSMNDSSTALSLRKKLKNLGMTNNEIVSIEKSGKASPVITIYANSSGHIHFLNEDIDMSSHALKWPKNNSNTNMLLKEGDYIQRGNQLFTIADESSIWAVLKIKQSEVELVKQGSKVDIFINNETFNGTVDFIEKSFDSENDFYTVRAYLNCENHNQFKIGTITKSYITINNDNKKIWIPRLAQVYLGHNKSAVFVKQDIGYIAQTIETGVTMGDWTEVLSGLEKTDSIAPIASYLVDSEAFIITK